MDPCLQLAQAPRQPKRKDTDQPPRCLRGQPVEAPHLEQWPAKWTGFVLGHVDAVRGAVALVLAVGCKGPMASRSRRRRRPDRREWARLEESRSAIAGPARRVTSWSKTSDQSRPPMPPHAGRR